ncbi:phage holin family protein [Streptomyces sp. ME02-8801-2C]|uniref:phage holin family protein n=1 Tax=Streptomyces sp. ME02-8801-2C TaxID=3028680 RepID=UPI0029A05915|nr:phage holin family protein [Streptomyces sp. ME02-8801-2C]MDX3451352.1 phage holin family protein [Streptomyces sp. ME02-8801-2C]
MDRIDHLEHLDKHLVDELAQVAREAVRDELRDQTRKQRRTAALYATSGAVALYAGAALALTLGLALAEGLPDWAAALITAAILGALAYALRNMARPGPSRTHPPAGSVGAAGDPEPGGGHHVPVPPVPPVAPGGPAPNMAPPVTPRWDDNDPEGPHHRA